MSRRNVRAAHAVRRSKRLSRRLLRRAAALGYEHIELWVVPDNVRARHVYEREGWTTDGTEKVEAVWGIELPEVRYTRAL